MVITLFHLHVLEDDLELMAKLDNISLIYNKN